MSLSTLKYTKDWTNAEDFPTVQTDENQVRADQQFLFNEIKAYLNDTLIPGIESAIAIACQDLVVGQLTDGSVTKNKLSSALIDVISRAESGGDLDARINSVSTGKVSKTGDTMTGNLFINKSAPEVGFKNTALTDGRSGYILMADDKTFNFGSYLNSSNSQSLYLHPETVALKSALKLSRRVNGVSNYYSVLHEGNLSDLGVARIATGSYTGTGTYGSDKPNRLTLPFEPKFLYISTATGFALRSLSSSTHVLYDTLFWQEGINEVVVFNDDVYISRSGNAISWYSSDMNSQLNETGKTYHYIAIG